MGRTLSDKVWFLFMVSIANFFSCNKVIFIKKLSFLLNTYFYFIFSMLYCNHLHPFHKKTSEHKNNDNLSVPFRWDVLRFQARSRMEETLKIQESAENYLETILILSQKKPQVRSIDIVNELAFSKPSVSVAMKNLRQNGYILMDKDGHITLTDAGREIAETIYERHQLLSQCLVRLGVDEQTAIEDACRIEHVISAKSFEAVKRHLKAH